MTEEFDPREARLLWQKVTSRPAGGKAGTVITALDLAAWLDGRADAALAARVESALASDDTLLQTALAAREAAETTEPAPERLLVRARAMVAPNVVRSRGGFWIGLASWRQGLEWVAIGACFLVVASGGFFVGGGLGENIAAASEPTEYALLDVSEDTSGLFEGI